MVERDSNTLLIYPVSDRSEDTLIPIIKRHVEAGSTIYSDGWSAYCGLNELGTTILLYFISTPSRKFTSIRIQGRKWRSTQIELKGPRSTPRSTFGGCPAQKFPNLRAVFARLCGGQRPSRISTRASFSPSATFTL